MDTTTARELLPEYLLGTLDPAKAVELESALATSPELRAEADALGKTLFALPDALEPEPLPNDAWTRLHASIEAEAAGERPPVHAAKPGTAHARVDEVDRTRTDETRAEPPVGETTIRRTRFPATALALAASIALLAGVGAWGVRGAQERAELANQQRIISYWMRNPELRIVSLKGIGPGAVVAADAPAEVPPGIVCVLPDGRAMMLQPYAAPDGSRYVLYGVGSEGRIELGSTRDRFLLFDAADLQGVELEVAGRLDAVVAEATF